MLADIEKYMSGDAVQSRYATPRQANSSAGTQVLSSYFVVQSRLYCKSGKPLQMDYHNSISVHKSGFFKSPHRPLHLPACIS